jgi:osmotically-inducible protein OsmY
MPRGDVSSGGYSVSNSRAILWAPLTLALPLCLGGCPMAIVGGLAAAGGAGYAANQERGMSGAVDDFTVKTNIQNAWIKANPNMQADLNVTVYEGRVLLTGSTPNPEMRAQAVQIARGVSGVKTVYDEIEVGPPETAMNSMKDTWITSRIKSDFVFDGKIRSVNYTVQTVNRSVYLIGSARSQQELDQATSLARNTADVKRVVSYVEIRPGLPPGAPQPTTTANMPPATGSGPEAPVAVPSTPVEVQKL